MVVCSPCRVRLPFRRELEQNRDLLNLERIKVPIPPLEIQRRIVDEIEAERALVDANRKLVEIFEQKIQDKLAEIWGETEQTA